MQLDPVGPCGMNERLNYVLYYAGTRNNNTALHLHTHKKKDTGGTTVISGEQRISAYISTRTEHLLQN